MKNKISKLVLTFFGIVALTIVFSSRNYIFADSSQVDISLESNPSNDSGGAKAYDIVLNFTGGSQQEKIDYVQAVVGFDKNDVTISDAVLSPANKLGRVLFEEKIPDANTKGKMKIELGALSPGAGPTTNQKLVIGTIKLQSKSLHPSFDMSGSQVVNNSSKAILIAPSSPRAGGFFSSIISFIRRFLGLK